MEAQRKGKHLSAQLYENREERVSQMTVVLLTFYLLFILKNNIQKLSSEVFFKKKCHFKVISIKVCLFVGVKRAIVFGVEEI